MRKISIAVVMIALLVGCSTHQKRVDSISDSMDVLSETWFAAQETALALHEAGALPAGKWAEVQAVQAKGSVVMRKLWAAWQELPGTDAAIEEFIASPGFLEGIQLTAQLATLADRLDLHIKLEGLQ